MMIFVIYCLVLLYSVHLVHLGGLILGAVLARVPIRAVSVGFGPLIGKYGVLEFRLLPLGGSVTLKNTQHEGLPTERAADAFDQQPRLVQVAIILAGPSMLIGMSMLVGGVENWHAFLRGFGQFISATCSPLSTAQDLIKSGSAYLESNGPLAGWGILSAKFAAFNLLPLPTMNGGDALMALLQVEKWSEQWANRLKVIGMMALLGIFSSNLLALLVYFGVFGNR